MKYKLFILLSILLIGIVSGANYYSTDPDNCPSSDGTNFPGQNCAPQDICGDSSGIAQCYDTSIMNPPSVELNTTGTGGTDYSCSDATCSGGYVTNCYASIDSGAPYCDNNGAYLCDRNATCYNKHVQTTCNGGSFISSKCSITCTTNYFACDGDTTDADGCEIHTGASCGSGTGTIASGQCYDADNGNCTSTSNHDCDDDDSDGNINTCNGANGCEITEGGSCTVGAISGSYSGCTCVVDKSYFETGTLIEYLTNVTQGAMLWFKNYFVDGNLINATNYYNQSFIVDNETNIITEGDLTIKGNDICNDTSCFTLQELNATGAGGGDNESWNESYADTLYWDIDDGSYNSTYDAYVTANYTNNSNYWDDLGTINATQMEDSGGILNILVSWLESLFYTESEVDDLITAVNTTYNATYDAYATNVSFGDSFVNETGDNMTGNLNLQTANITFDGAITMYYNGSDFIIE